jgi:putative transposon-encoded protein
MTSEIQDIQDLNQILNKIGIEAVFKDKVKKYGTGAHVYIPKEYTGSEVIVIIKSVEKPVQIIN